MTPSPHPFPLAEAVAIAKAHPHAFAQDILAREDSRDLPIAAFSAGSLDPKAPLLILVGGMRGDDTAGAEFVLGWMEALCPAGGSSPAVAELLARARVVAIPAANPHGLARRSRFNGHGVELGLNAPVDAQNASTPFLYGGHRIMPWLPGYRGKRGAPMQIETQALVDFVLANAAQRRCVIVVDCSGQSGSASRLWFPHRHTTDPMPWLPIMARLQARLAERLPERSYKLGPGWREHHAHGSPWDHVLAEASGSGLGEGRLVLLSLTMGRAELPASPSEPALLSAPARPRFQRHASLAEFLLRAAADSAIWTDIDPSERSTLLSLALQTWWPDTDGWE